jgi:molybdopterin/thiamine biosynthesis adenylyltransferase
VLSELHRERYSRQLSIECFGEKAQERLAGAQVFVAGAGGLGCSASLYMAAAGVGGLRIVDHGEVELSNLNRQVLYTEGDIGAPKVGAMARMIGGLNAGVHVEPVRATLDAETLPSLLRGCHLILDALDNLPTRLHVNRAALGLGIPIIHGAVRGFGGQVMTIVPGETACLRCLYRDPVVSETTPVIGVSSGVIGLLQATEAIKYLTGLGRQLRGILLLFDGLEMSFTRLEVPRDPDCPGCRRSRE